MRNHRDADTVIVGAGSIGICAAEHLAAENQDVIILEKDDFMDSASANASAFISNWWYFLEGEHLPGTTKLLREYFQDLDGTHDFEFHKQPFVSLIDESETDDEDTVRMTETVDDVPGFTYMDAAELEATFPATLNLDGFVGGIVDTQAGYIDPQPYLEAMKSRAEANGAEFRSNCGVTDIKTTDGHITGVQTETGDEILCDTLVVAAGTNTQPLVAEYVDLPVRSFVICAAEVAGDPSYADTLPTTSGRGTLIGPNRAGNLLVGDEYWISDPADIPQEFPQEAHEKIVDLLPQLFTDATGDFEYVPGGGHRCPEGITITPDQFPVIDELDKVDGLVVADGSRGAVSLAPVISVAIRELITGTPAPFPVERFAIDRFEDTPTYDLPMITHPTS